MRNNVYRVLGAVLLSVTMAAGMSEPAAAEIAVAPPSLETQFVERINAFRALNGLKPVSVHSELTDVARRWTIGMANDNTLRHNLSLPRQVRANWKRLGENVGHGPTVDEIFEAFLASPSHRANIVDPTFTQVGVGVVADESGLLYTAHEFMSMRTAKAKAKARRPARRR